MGPATAPAIHTFDVDFCSPVCADPVGTVVGISPGIESAVEWSDCAFRPSWMRATYLEMSQPIQ